MSTVFSNSRLPLWVWIVIIAVGSLVSIGTFAFLARLIIIRRREADFLDTFGDENLPERKVTVRRGRVVEQSKYLSLTGSKFGLNAFNAEENDSRAGARSKSPFEWWSTVKDRSSSRNSQVTQFTATNDTNSIYGLPTSPNQQRVFQRRDLNHSNLSLTSTSKDEDVSVTVSESIPSSSPPPIRNFSRSFARPSPYNKFSPRQNTLSCIEESSPHTSVISTRQSRIMSYMSATKRDTKSSLSSSSIAASPALASQFPDPPRWSILNRSKASSIYLEAEEQTTQEVAIPPPVAYNGSRSSYGDPQPRSLHVANYIGREGNQRNSKRESSQITALPEHAGSKEPNNYWGTRNDLLPVRTNSKKGKVLRKKSLKKAEVVSMIDS